MAEYVSAFLRELVRARAHNRCEYCLILEFTQAATFHVDHCIPSAEGGVTVAENLALACPHCDRQKWDRLEGVDPATNLLAPLFNPRQHAWRDHFKFNGYAIIGISDIGRATVEIVGLNHLPKLRARQAEEFFGLFPPTFDSSGKPN